MTGVVLCGGRSTRMGSDKGLLVHGTTTWAQLAVEKLASLRLPVLLSVNEQQFTTYQSLFPVNALIRDDATLTVGGPLAGLLSVHTQYPKQNLMVLACDMIAVSETILQYLLQQYAQHQPEAMVFINDHQTEPLTGIYSAEGLQKAAEWYRNGQLKKCGLIDVLKVLHSIYLPIPPEWKHCFINCNTPADLRGFSH